ncbi:unnamed protein product [Periconia digitata]|uniref:Secreted protein n=1 Tax=Periconia digitata TaxID=1303443 RepID=A0A9W4U1X1_9PLEO|nr:unnamed protein product [Periconia digitata]
MPPLLSRLRWLAGLASATFCRTERMRHPPFRCSHPASLILLPPALFPRSPSFCSSHFPIHLHSVGGLGSSANSSPSSLAPSPRSSKPFFLSSSNFVCVDPVAAEINQLLNQLQQVPRFFL